MKRFLFWLRNLPHRRTARAYSDLTQAMRDDPSFAESWRANIAMIVLDNSGGQVSHADANRIADQMMRFLFGVTGGKP